MKSITVNPLNLTDSNQLHQFIFNISERVEYYFPKVFKSSSTLDKSKNKFK